MTDVHTTSPTRNDADVAPDDDDTDDFDDISPSAVSYRHSTRQGATRRKTWPKLDPLPQQQQQQQQMSSCGNDSVVFRPDRGRNTVLGNEANRADRSGQFFSYDDDDFTDDDDDHIYENPPDIVIEETRRELYRHKIVEEFLEIEDKYVQKLDFILKIKNQLESINSVNFFMPPEDVDKMFPQIETLHTLHSRTIVPAFRAVLRNWTENSFIGFIFINHLPQLKVYETFIKAFPRAAKTRETWSSNEPKFAKLLQMFQQNSAAKQLDLEDIFHEPYIKLQRWKLLVQRYQKYLPPFHRDSTDIPKVLDAFDRILLECEETLRQAENLEILLGLEEQIEGLMVFLTSDTQYLKDGPVMKIDPRSQRIGQKALNRTEIPLHIFLFNGFLLICTPKQTKKKQTVCSKMMLAAIKLMPGDCLTSMGYSADRCLILQSTRKALPLLFQSAEEREDWQLLISKARHASRQRMTIKTETSCADFTCAPIWLPDDCTPCCMLCCRDFSIIRARLRHHCRGCGIIMCSHCSPGKIKVPYKSMSPELVCTNCYNRARKWYPALLLVKPRNSTEDLRSTNSRLIAVDSDDNKEQEQVLVDLCRTTSLGQTES